MNCVMQCTAKSPTSLSSTPEISKPVLLYHIVWVMMFNLQIAGDGLALAQAVVHNVATPNALVPPPQIPLLSDILPNFNHNLPSYNHGDILWLIIFYNDFGIVQGDTLPSRINSFHNFLSEILS